MLSHPCHDITDCWSSVLYVNEMPCGMTYYFCSVFIFDFSQEYQSLFGSNFATPKDGAEGPSSLCLLVHPSELLQAVTQGPVSHKKKKNHINKTIPEVSENSLLLRRNVGECLKL